MSSTRKYSPHRSTFPLHSKIDCMIIKDAVEFFSRETGIHSWAFFVAIAVLAVDVSSTRQKQLQLLTYRSRSCGRSARVWSWLRKHLSTTSRWSPLFFFSSTSPFVIPRSRQLEATPSTCMSEDIEGWEGEQCRTIVRAKMIGTPPAPSVRKASKLKMPPYILKFCTWMSKWSRTTVGKEHHSHCSAVDYSNAKGRVQSLIQVRAVNSLWDFKRRRTVTVYLGLGYTHKQSTA